MDVGYPFSPAPLSDESGTTSDDSYTNYHRVSREGSLFRSGLPSGDPTRKAILKVQIVVARTCESGVSADARIIR